jgi:hypothetical protein
MAVTAAAVRFAVEYVRGSLGTQANPFRGRPVGGIYPIPATATGTVHGGAQHLAVLRASPPFRRPNGLGRLGRSSRRIAISPFGPQFPLGPVIPRLDLIANPVESHQSPRHHASTKSILTAATR